MHLRTRGVLNFDIHNDAADQGLFNGQHLFFIFTILLMVIGLLLVAFSKEKIEDEQISQLRLDSLQWAVYLNYLVLIGTAIFMNRNDFKDMLYLNLWVPLAFFIIRFRWVLFRLNRSLTKEK
jgi:cell division protein FtsW (lipid II flippase)